MNKSLVEMTARIIQSQMSSKQMNTDDIRSALNETFKALKSLQDVEAGGTVEQGVEITTPAVDPKKSIQKNKIVCLECGQEFKTLSSKHLMSHGLDGKDYRKKYGFSARQPLCAKALSDQRSAAGKKRGIPANLQKAIVARSKKKPVIQEEVNSMSHTIEAHFKGQKRTIILEIGKKYRIMPMNIAKKKNIERTCTLLDLNDNFMPTEATVKWEDTGRKGKVKTLSDLVLLKE